jgi:hypothetical protein
VNGLCYHTNSLRLEPSGHRQLSEAAAARFDGLGLPALGVGQQELHVLLPAAQLVQFTYHKLIGMYSTSQWLTKMHYVAQG